MTTSESKGRFFTKRIFRIDSHNESNRFESRIGMFQHWARAPAGWRAGGMALPGRRAARSTSPDTSIHNCRRLQLPPPPLLCDTNARMQDICPHWTSA